jgi:5-methyltetrahydropteroyltriglutamate--homocysteine methyltransferase
VDLGVLRLLPRKQIILGVIDLADDSPVEPLDTVRARIRDALAHVEPERLVLAPDCGMKYLPRAVAFEKLRVLVAAASAVRSELGGY